MTWILTMPRESWLRYLVRVALLAVIIYLLWRVRLAIVILMLGALSAYAMRPLVSIFEFFRIGNWRIRRGLAVALAFILVIGCLVGLVLAVLPPLGRELAEFKANLPAHEEAFQERFSAARDFYQRNLPPSVRDALDSSVADTIRAAQSRVKRIVEATIGGISLIIELILVPILAVYFLADAEGLRRQVAFFIPEQLQPGFLRTLDGFNTIMYRYVLGQLVLCLLAFGVVSLGLYLLGIKFWLLLGLIAGITRAIPVIGPLVGGIPVISAVLMQSQSLSYGIWVTIGFTLLHLFESKYLMPAILGRQLDLHPVLIILSLLVGAEFFGIIGMFIAVPILAGIRFLIADYRRHHEPTEPVLQPTQS